uniref:Uncharacterized protein n=1 Tax=Populus trichocarpa TaxID=3694 RepID=A0A3N7FU21_POPTR
MIKTVWVFGGKRPSPFASTSIILFTLLLNWSSCAPISLSKNGSKREETSSIRLGDKFIPNRSSMNLDQANCLLTNKTKDVHNPNFSVCRKKLEFWMHQK